MSKCLPTLLLLTLSFMVAASTARADYPQPSPYPVTWQLDFRHGKPTRLVMHLPGKSEPQAYWYMTYTVTNNTDQEQLFLPEFDLVTHEGKIVRNDTDIPKEVFDTIKHREGMRFLKTDAQIGGELRIGDDQAKDGVAIWPEPSPRMGQFQIYVSGLSGETATVKGPNGKPQILRKTLELNYLVRGNSPDAVVEQPQRWVMR